MLLRAALGCFLGFVVASVGFAQQAVRLGIGAVGVFPVGLYSKRQTNGPGIMASLTFAGSEGSFLGFRVDVSDAKINGHHLGTETVPSYNITSVTANLVATASTESFKPYAVAGGGWYTFRDSVDAQKRRNRAGLEGGVGVAFPFIVTSGFLEVRYHRVFNNDAQMRYVALSAGILL